MWTVRWTLGGVIACVAFGAAACSSSDDDAGSNASTTSMAGSGGTSDASGTAGSGGAGPALGGVGGSQAGAGGSRAGGGGLAPTGGGSAGRAGGGATSAGAGGATSAGAGAASAQGGGAGLPSTDGLGALCAYTDLSGELDAIEDDFCSTNYCLWDGRSLGDTYCTIPCEGSSSIACGDGYQCTEDTTAPGKYWCAQKLIGVPDDLGMSCPAPSLCYNSSHPQQSFCESLTENQCETEFCVGDPMSDDSYCSMPCNQTKGPCPDGWDCRRNPSGITGVHDVCTKHHDPIEYTGLPCYMGLRSCDSAPCPTVEDGSTYSCAAYGGGICMFDTRVGATYSEYCSASCDGISCPAGFVCTDLTTNGDPQAPPSGKYCVQDL